MSNAKTVNVGNLKDENEYEIFSGGGKMSNKSKMQKYAKNIGIGIGIVGVGALSLYIAYAHGLNKGFNGFANLAGEIALNGSYKGYTTIPLDNKITKEHIELAVSVVEKSVK